MIVPFLVPFLIAILIFVLLLVFWSLQKNSNTNIINSFWDKFQTIFEEDAIDHQWSANRVAYVFTMLISNLVLWGGVLYLVLHSYTFPEIPQGVIFIYGISNGVASIAKVWQKREERFASQLENSTDNKKKDE